jgi:hypothetical protein
MHKFMYAQIMYELKPKKYQYFPCAVSLLSYFDPLNCSKHPGVDTEEWAMPTFCSSTSTARHHFMSPFTC